MNEEKKKKNGKPLAVVPPSHTILSDLPRTYPDILPPEEMEGVLKLERIEGARTHAPKILWGATYQMWDDKRKIKYLNQFAASMNQAADLLQTERNTALDLAHKSEAVTKSVQAQLVAANKMFTIQLGRANDKANKRALHVQELEAEVRALKANRDGD